MKSKFFVSFLGMVFFLFACAQTTTSTEEQSIVTSLPLNMSAIKFQEVIKKPGTQILDVRTVEEFKSGHIANALQANIMDAAEFEDRVQHLNKNTVIYVYCQSGGRSASAQNMLMQRGFKVVNLEGGISNWKMNQLPLEGSENKVQMRVEDYDKVIADNKMVLVDIGATWCPPCRKMQPIIDQIKKEKGSDLYFLAVDGGTDMEIMKHVFFQSLPTFIIYKNGKEVWRKQGIVAAEEFQKVFAAR